MIRSYNVVFEYLVAINFKMVYARMILELFIICVYYRCNLQH